MPVDAPLPPAHLRQEAAGEHDPQAARRESGDFDQHERPSILFFVQTRKGN